MDLSMIQATGARWNQVTALDAASQRGSTAGLSESAKIDEAARQFEAMLVRHMLAEARKPVIRSGMEEASATRDIYQDLVNEHLAEAITKGGGLGVARSLSTEWQRQEPGGRTEDAGKTVKER
jgi:flagellar protein FlgJ